MKLPDEGTNFRREVLRTTAMRSRLADLLTTALSSSGSVTDLSSGEVVAFTELLSRTRRHAVAPGEHVALFLHPGPTWIEHFLALLLGGAAAVPLALTAAAPELTHYLREARVDRVIADEAHAPRIAPLLEGRPLRVIPSASEIALNSQSRSTATARVISDASLALILFTSGTTGKPKAAALTHANLHAQTRTLREAWNIVSADTLTTSLPMHHLHGVVVAVLTCLTAGASVRVFQRFDSRALLADLRHATLLMTVPTILQRLTDALEESPQAATHARALRLVTSGSAALPASLAERWLRLTGELPLERYGMTEIGIALSNPLEPSERKPGQVGRPLTGVEIALLDDAGTVLEAATSDGVREGELAVRGPSVFAGYLGPDGARAPLTADGFFRTGDVVRQNADGTFKILGRTSSDILKTGGEKVSALEVEEVCREHPGVAEVAVVGVPDETWGDRIVAFIVVAPAVEVAGFASVLETFLRERLAPYKRPKELRFIDELPRNTMGKVQKQLLPR